MPVLSIDSAASVEPAALHAVLSAAFADYLIGPFSQPFAAWPAFLGSQAVDLAESRVMRVDGELGAFALVAPRNELRIWRLAVMGAAPAARRTGAAPALLDDFIARAAGGGMTMVELECFAQNERALHLYRGRGFEPVAELFGYQREKGQPLVDTGVVREPVTVSMEEACTWLDDASRERGDLPLQVTGLSIRARTVPLHAMRLGSAQVVCTKTDQAVTIVSLVDLDERQADAQALVASWVRQHPNHRFAVPQHQRHDVGGAALERAGFTRLPLHQFLMRRALPARS
jgi:ribosomal protein S18 acetylase RimI-like enzyme